MKIFSFAFSSLFMLVGVAFAAPSIKPESYDFDGNGELSPKERRVFLIHRASPIHQQFDVDKNGDLDPNETAAWQKELNTSVSLDEMDLTGARIPTVPVPVKKMDFLERKADNPSQFDVLWGVQIRRALDDVDPDWNPEVAANEKNYQAILEKIPPALVAFTRDNNAGSDTWAAHGVVARAFDLSPSEELFTLLPSISFDRVDTSAKGSTKEENSLVFRLGVVKDLWGADFSTQPEDAGKYTFRIQARANALYSTDFDFRRSIWGGELNLEPVLTTPKFGLHVFREYGPFYARPSIFMHSEFGQIDTSVALPGFERSYARMGPQAALEIVPNFSASNPLAFLNKRLLIDTAYGYFWDLAGSTTNIRYFRTSASLKLDQRGHVKLIGEYQRGSLQFDSQNVDIVTVGMGVAF